MKKLITIALAVSMLLSFCSCSFIRDVRSEFIKKQILASFNSGDTLGVSEESGSFDALFEPFLGDFMISGIQSDSGLKKVWKNAHLLALDYSSLTGSMYIFYNPTQKKAYQYFFKGEKVTSVGSSKTEENPTTLFSAFGLDVSMFYQEKSNKPAMRDLTAEDLTVSDDYKTCYISEDYIKELAKASYVTDEIYSEKELERYFEGFTGSGALNIEENTLEISFSSTGENAPKMAVDMVFTFVDAESMNALITVKSEQAIDGQIVPMEITMSINELRMVEDKPVKMDMAVTTKYRMQESGITVDGSKTDVCKIDVTDASKSKLLLTSNQKLKYTQNGSLESQASSEVYFEIDTSKTEEALVYRTKNNNSLTLEITADSVFFGEHESVAPASVRQKYSSDSAK